MKDDVKSKNHKNNSALQKQDKFSLNYIKKYVRRKFFFDKRDHRLLSIVKDVLAGDSSYRFTRKLIYPYLHPMGIKEMGESKGLRIAYAVVHLLESLEIGGIDERLSALRCLRDEVLNASDGSYPKNTARVLLQIMKELVRLPDNYYQQLKLAHDFRIAATGKPRTIRKLLKRYNLLEMSEKWNQITFDDHVHDVNTKGRKTSSHLIMDAWIKGIKRVRVIYYNYVESGFAVEVLESAQIMGIDIKIGIEFSARFRNKYVQLIWVPRGFYDSQSFLCFLAEKSVMDFFKEGRAVSLYKQSYVMAVFDKFNEKYLPEINTVYGLNLKLLDKQEFLLFVGTGQASILHLAEFIYSRLLPVMCDCVKELRECYADSDASECLRIENLVKDLNKLDNNTIIQKYLQPQKNPEIPDPNAVCDLPDTPSLLNLSPKELIDKLSCLHSAYRITFNLTDIKVEDVLEVLYDCKGMITRLEIFNLKDYTAGKTDNIPDINELQQAINDDNVINLKRIIRKIIIRIGRSDDPEKDNRIKKLSTILYDITTFKDLYKGHGLKARIGSDSTERLLTSHGMGLAIINTLPKRSQKQIKKGLYYDFVPVNISAFRRTTYIHKTHINSFMKFCYSLFRRFSVLRVLGEKIRNDWLVCDDSIKIKNSGNIVTLGGISTDNSNSLTLFEQTLKEGTEKISVKYLNSGLKNGLKVFVGFIPAFLTFVLTKDWWLLAYFGAFIWFSITGLRNVIQSVLGGGGIWRSPLLRWNDYVSWERISDSLLYTGFSVPLLDYLVKTVLLERCFDITTATNPALLYGFMGLANGVYLSGHNAFRGLPRAAVAGNFFRSILSIPIAILLNTLVGGVLLYAGYAEINNVLQKWAAVISKGASDFVAGLIEGFADRYHNIRKRLREYNTKVAQIFNIYSKLELLFPEVRVMEILEVPNIFKQKRSAELLDFEQIMIINALDMLYFWMYQPRARTAFGRIMQTLSNEEQQILIGSLFVLNKQKQISLLFVDGLVGKNFSKALSFYLSNFESYIEVMGKKYSNRCRPSDR